MGYIVLFVTLISFVVSQENKKTDASVEVVIELEVATPVEISESNSLKYSYDFKEKKSDLTTEECFGIDVGYGYLLSGFNFQDGICSDSAGKTAKKICFSGHSVAVSAEACYEKETSGKEFVKGKICIGPKLSFRYMKGITVGSEICVKIDHAVNQNQQITFKGEPRKQKQQNKIEQRKKAKSEIQRMEKKLREKQQQKKIKMQSP